ncbi:MAG: zinc ribbon domain-containing protein [Gammaproteobacteria bacterium]|nr:zinc ribbon domain-containing protein [Gammaproteobacteria bacterium]
MPIYEYQCDACGHQFDVLQKLSDAPLSTCPECAEESLRKLISAAAFRLKGSGWYETDFKRDNQRNLAGDKKDDKPAKDAKGGKDKAADKPAKADKKADAPKKKEAKKADKTA